MTVLNAPAIGRDQAIFAPAESPGDIDGARQLAGARQPAGARPWPPYRKDIYDIARVYSLTLAQMMPSSSIRP